MLEFVWLEWGDTTISSLLGGHARGLAMLFPILFSGFEHPGGLPGRGGRLHQLVTKCQSLFPSYPTPGNYNFSLLEYWLISGVVTAKLWNRLLPKRGAVWRVESSF